MPPKAQLEFPYNGDEDKDRVKRDTKSGRGALPYSDINLTHWRQYPQVWTDSLWIVESRARGKGHKLDYYGNFVPQIASQVFERYSRHRDVVLDMFLGSGTSAIEALNMDRRLIGVEISEAMIRRVRDKLGSGAAERGVHVIHGDSSSRAIIKPVREILKTEGCEQAQLLVLHPPYHNIIRFTQHQNDLSNIPNTRGFLKAFRRVAKIGYELLESGRFAVLVIGDKYEDKELIPLGFLSMEQMNRVGFRTKSIIVKNMVGNERGKGKASNLWRYRALAGGFYIFKHEYVIIFQKP